MHAERLVAIIDQITPFDRLEAEHRTDALTWLGSTADIYRRIPPKTPPKHLVAYFLLHDHTDGSVLLGHHRKAGLWLPTGGHLEIGEDPVDTVRREASEELGVRAVFADQPARPRFLTVTETVGGPESRHTDVSLWYLLRGSRSAELHPDQREFAAARWWTRAEIDTADADALEPHLSRFLRKVDATRR